MERFADVLLGAAWAVVVVHSLVLAAREPGAGRMAPRLALGVALVAATAVLAAALERRAGGRVVAHPALAIAGTLLVLAGAALHVHTRSLFGPAWSSAPEPAAATPREDGPWARVRHPLYAAIVVMLAGTVLAHPSVASGCGALGMTIGLALKIRREERALAAAFGPRWDAYRARVPCLVPRLGRPGRAS